MAKRRLYKRNYERVFEHLKTNSEWEEEVLQECRKLLSGAMSTKGDNSASYFDHLEFRLRETFGVEVAKYD